MSHYQHFDEILICRDIKGVNTNKEIRVLQIMSFIQNGKNISPIFFGNHEMHVLHVKMSSL